MSKVKFLLAACALAYGLLGAGTTSAEAATRYGIVTLRNPTSIDVHYQFKWGEDADWKSWTVDSGTSMYHWCELDDDDTAPPPYVRFDYILGDDDVTWKTYHLQFYASNRKSADRGKPYAFKTTRGGRQLELYAE